MSSLSEVTSEWEKQERAIKQAQVERREKVLTFTPDFIGMLLLQMLSGSEFVITEKDGRQRIVKAEEHVLPGDAQVSRVDVGRHNLMYSADTDQIMLRIVSTEFDPVAIGEPFPVIGPALFTERRSEQPINLSTANLAGTSGLPWLTVPGDGLEIDVNKERFEITQPKELESEDRVRLVIRPKNSE